MSHQLLSMVTRRAAKKHKCIWCGEAIEAGENYRDERSVYDGDMQSFHWHLECRGGAEAGWQGGDDGEFMPYSQERPQRAAAPQPAAQAAPTFAAQQGGAA